MKDVNKEEKLLFIAPSVPRYDQSSGDLRLLSVLEILIKSYGITYFPNSREGNGEGSDCRYIKYLRDLGVCVAREDWSIIQVLRKEKYKAAIIEHYHMAEQYLPRIRIIQPSCPIIVDTVDVHFRRIYLKYEITKKLEDLHVAEKTKGRELDIYKKADLVITVTEEDSEILIKECSDLNLRIIPNIHRLVLRKDFGKKNELIFVGGFSHDPNIDAILYFCKNILPIIRSRIPDVKLTVVGSNPPEEIRDLENDFVRVTGYVPSITPYLQKSYISVAPLRYGAGMKGKIGEAMAHGIPVVTTSIGAQGMGLLNGKNAMIADTPVGFAGAVFELWQNDTLYKSIRENAIGLVRNSYTEPQVGKRIFEILNGLRKMPIKRMSFSEKTCFLLNYGMDYIKGRLGREG